MEIMKVKTVSMLILMQNKHSKGLSANQIRGVELYISVLIKNISLPKVIRIAKFWIQLHAY